VPAETLKVPAPDAARQEQTINNVRQFASSHLDRHANLSCAQVATTASTKTITVEFTDVAHRGTPSSLDATGMIQDVLAISSGTDFEFDHYGTIGGKPFAAYRYSFQTNGKTHAGLIYADEETGAISRVTFRGADQAAHLFCSSR
jgi:hypothetical protein